MEFVKKKFFNRNFVAHIPHVSKLILIHLKHIMWTQDQFSKSFTVTQQNIHCLVLKVCVANYMGTDTHSNEI